MFEGSGLLLPTKTLAEDVHRQSGGKLSPLDGIGPKEIGIETLDKIVSSGSIKEIILAVNYTVESDVTAHVISELAIKNSVKITRLAQGVPVGGELEYLDQRTLSKAFDKRTIY